MLLNSHTKNDFITIKCVFRDTYKINNNFNAKNSIRINQNILTPHSDPGRPSL